MNKNRFEQTRWCRTSAEALVTAESIAGQKRITCFQIVTRGVSDESGTKTEYAVVYLTK